MKLGPLHVVTQRTMAIMQQMIQGLADRLAEVDHERGRLTKQLAEGLVWAGASSHLHYTSHARVAPNFLLDTDADTPRSRRAVARVIRAYARARKDTVRAAPCVWDIYERRSAALIEALNRRDERRAGEFLRRMFQTTSVQGLGFWHDQLPALIRQQAECNGFSVRVSDLLLGLAEAVGAVRIGNPEQGLDDQLRALDVDLVELLRITEQATGLDLAFPEVGGAYGCVIDGKRVTPDSLYHAYTVCRLKELGASSAHRLAEIGGGFGCLAYQAFRAGFTDYAIYDLPWVNALQAYFLIMALPEGSVRLYGEREGQLAVLPGWCFHRLEDRSVDWVINVNSLPEMGAKTARDYLLGIRRVLRQRFLSINMEAKTVVPNCGPQNCVAELIAELGGFLRLSRSRYWMRHGYVEEVYEPDRT